LPFDFDFFIFFFAITYSFGLPSPTQNYRALQIARRSQANFGGWGSPNRRKKKCTPQAQRDQTNNKQRSAARISFEQTNKRDMSKRPAEVPQSPRLA
jgi:hypothetical protein